MPEEAIGEMFGQTPLLLGDLSSSFVKGRGWT